MLRKAPFLVLAVLLCAGCSSMQTDRQVTSRFDPDRLEVDMDRDNLAKSFQSPLYMLNLKQEDIPELLPTAAETYEEPNSCLMAKVEYERLDYLLGVDEAVAAGEEYGTITLDAGDAISSAIDDMIPFESVIKYVSGATRHEKKVEAAFFRGQIRRAYLRGYVNRNLCEIPVPGLKPGSQTYTAQLNTAGPTPLGDGDIAVSSTPRSSSADNEPDFYVTENAERIAASPPQRLTPYEPEMAAPRDGLLGLRD